MNPGADSERETGSGDLALQLGVLAVVFDLGLTRLCAGPQLWQRVLFDLFCGVGLALTARGLARRLGRKGWPGSAVWVGLMGGLCVATIGQLEWQVLCWVWDIFIPPLCRPFHR